jgi:hypothetical protein
MHKFSSENRTQSIKRVAEQISDSEMIFKVTSEDFAENALYHSACIKRYLLRNIKTEIEEPPMSEHEHAFDQFISTIQKDLLIHKKVFYLNHLLEKFVPFLPKDMREVTQRIGFSKSWRNTLVMLSLFNVNKGRVCLISCTAAPFVSLKLSTRLTV